MCSWSVVFQKEIASTVSPMAGGNSYPWALSFSDSFQFFPHAESLFKFISFLTVWYQSPFTSVLLCVGQETNSSLKIFAANKFLWFSLHVILSVFDWVMHGIHEFLEVRWCINNCTVQEQRVHPSVPPPTHPASICNYIWKAKYFCGTSGLSLESVLSTFQLPVSAGRKSAIL